MENKIPELRKNLLETLKEFNKKYSDKDPIDISTCNLTAITSVLNIALKNIDDKDIRNDVTAEIASTILTWRRYDK